jgi:hypothetical protein
MCKPGGKVMATIYWCRKGVLLLDFMEKNHNNQSSAILLRAIVKRQRPALLTTGVASAS